MDTKQVIVIRRDLKMRRGKEIAQGAHAAAGWLIRKLASSRALTDAERQWLSTGTRKICVTVTSEEELLRLDDLAKENGLTAELILDRGDTEFGGVLTWTALAIGPDYDDRIDPVTRDLTLY